jgi:ribonuclease VapC
VIVDTSALLAIVRAEPDAAVYADLLAATDAPLMSAASYVEAAIVVDASRDPVVSRRFDELVQVAALSIAPVTAEQAHIAREAYRDFGRGSGHPARLNFGDCFAYALAKERADALLFKGNDFAHTDVIVAAPRSS